MCKGSTSIKKYLPLQRGGLLPQPVRHDTCWLPDLPQITMMLSHWASVNYNIHWLYQTHRQISNIHIHGHMHKFPHAAAMLISFRGSASGFDPPPATPCWGGDLYIYIFFQISFPSLSSKRRGLTSRCFIVFVTLIIHQADRSLSQQLLLMILSASPLSGAAACPEW